MPPLRRAPYLPSNGQRHHHDAHLLPLSLLQPFLSPFFRIEVPTLASSLPTAAAAMDVLAAVELSRPSQIEDRQALRLVALVLSAEGIVPGSSRSSTPSTSSPPPAAAVELDCATPRGWGSTLARGKSRLKTAKG